MPKHLVVVGAGVIGLELGSVWRRLGSKVTVVEFLDRIVPGIDGEIAKQFQRSCSNAGHEFKLAPRSPASTRQATTLKASVEPAAGGAAETIEADVDAGRDRPSAYTDGLGLDEAGVTRSSAAASSPMRISRPTSPASAPSAT